jgi:hypothetical protein
MVQQSGNLNAISSDSSGFWSYAHEDNELDGGSILRLADLISKEYNLLSGDSLELFVDNTSIDWGDEWRRLVDDALTRTTFFIPIVTPRYFTRTECRRELLEFAAKAKSLGVEEFLLPILYVRPANFTSDNPDEAIALIARMQYVDWTENRLMDPRSPSYKSSVNNLATRLIDIASRVQQSQFDKELAESETCSDIPGIQDLMAEVTELLPDWLDAVIGDRIYKAQLDPTWHEAYRPVVRLQRAHAPASAVMAAQVRAGKELLAVLERHRNDAQVYLSRSAQLDPLVSALSRLVASDPGGFPLVIPLREAIDEAMRNINIAREPLEPGGHTIGDHIRELKHRARVFQRCDAAYRQYVRLAQEGNSIVRRWDSELRPIQLAQQNAIESKKDASEVPGGSD